MAQAEIVEVINVSKDAYFSAITSYDRYPEFVSGCTRATVKRLNEKEAEVTYAVSIMKDIEYTLHHGEDRSGGVLTWKLIKSAFLKKNEGRWLVEDAGPGKCRVSYTIEIEFAFPAPGFIVSKLIKGPLPAMLKSFEKLARTHEKKA